MELNKFLKRNCTHSDIHYLICRIIYDLWLWKNYKRFSREAIVRRRYKHSFGKDLDLQNPITLNEKIQWLKLNEFHDYYTICADKYAMKSLIAERFGNQYNVPVIFHTSDWREITKENITKFPCIVKANHSSHDYMIFYSEQEVDWMALRRLCRFWLHRDYFAESQELQYKDIPRQIIVEELLQTREGKIPNDYKLHYINGKLAFVYVSIDREGLNVRNIYDENWKPLPCDWDSDKDEHLKKRVIDVSSPASFEKMKQFGAEIAKQFKYIRVDYYDVDGQLYFGEITLHHGGGYNKFRPSEWDTYFGNMLSLA
ncbi:MAG: hypothetical protein II970_04175 [Paludibacteraceae bacterium]|nr:hypothetical protein [Paludibacteraceae bacterium]